MRSSMESITEWLEPGERIESTFRVGKVTFFFMVLFQLLLLFLLSLPLIFAVFSVGLVMHEAPLLLAGLVPVLFVVTIIAGKAVVHVLEPKSFSRVLATVDMPAATSTVYLTNKHLGQKTLRHHPLIAYGEIESIKPMGGFTDMACELLFGVRKMQLHTHFKVQSLSFYLPVSECGKILTIMNSRMQEARKKE